MDEIELNRMDVYVWYDVMFVNNMDDDQDMISSGKEIPVLKLLGCALFGNLIHVGILTLLESNVLIYISQYMYGMR